MGQASLRTEKEEEVAIQLLRMKKPFVLEKKNQKSIMQNK